jgi:hypothetical protein
MLYPRSFAFICGLIAVSPAFSQMRTITDAEVQKIHKSALLIDTHNDITSRTVTATTLEPPRTTATPTSQL